MPKEPIVQNAQPSLIARSDTLFGVCQGIGEDLGFNPLYLRLALTALLFFYPLAALATYVGAGLMVAVAHRLYPNPRRAAETELVAEQRRSRARRNGSPSPSPPEATSTPLPPSREREP